MAIRIDYRGVSTPTHFLLHTVKETGTLLPLRSKARITLKRLFDGAELKSGRFGVELKIKASQSDRRPIDLLYNVLASINNDAKNDEIVIFALDEIPMAIQNVVANSNDGPSEAAYLLQQLRNLRQCFGRLRWLLTGSVGFHHVLKQCAKTTTCREAEGS